MGAKPRNIEGLHTDEPAGLSRRLMLTQLAAAGVVAVAGSTLLAAGEAQARVAVPAGGPQPATPQPASAATAPHDACEAEQELAHADRVEGGVLDDLEISSRRRRRYWRRRRYYWRRRWRRRYRRWVCRRRRIRGRLVRVCRRRWWW